jgi:indolepyruvate decarboxylase
MKVKDYIASEINRKMNHCFSIPGDYNLALLDSINNTNIKQIYCTNELNMSYSADGYARINGLAVMVTTFSVGSLSAINGIAGAYAEYSPVLHISCGPKISKDHVFHHTIGEIDTDYVKKCYENVTIYSEKITRAEQITKFLPKALYLVQKLNKPAYLEIPTNLLYHEINSKLTIREFNIPATKKIKFDSNDYKTPLIVLGNRIGRKENLPYPVCCMPNAKGKYNEEADNYMGIYWEDISDDFVSKLVKKADIIIYLGCLFNDYNTNGFTQVKNKAIIVDELSNNLKINQWAKKEKLVVRMNNKQKLDLDNLQNKVNKLVNNKTTIIAETGTSWWTCLKFNLKKETIFQIQMQYGSIGWSLGASLGCFLAKPENNIFLFIGDGSIQMTVQELSTLIRYKAKGIIFLINNKGYVIEDAIHKGDYNDIPCWDYNNIFKSFGGKNIETIKNVNDLDKSLEKFKQKRDLYLFNCIISNKDITEKLVIWGKNVSKFNKK